MVYLRGASRPNFSLVTNKVVPRGVKNVSSKILDSKNRFVSGLKKCPFASSCLLIIP